MQASYFTKVVLCVGAACLLVSEAAAVSLRDRVDTLFGNEGIELAPAAAGSEQFSHAVHFTSDSFATLGNLVGSLAANAADFNVVSTTPGFVYRYNPDLKLFERMPGSLGPIFAERAETVGRGRFDIGMSYLYVDYSTLDGDSLNGLTFQARHEPIVDHPAFVDDTISLTFTKFELTSQVFSFYGTYGITDNWDVNLLVPVVYTTLDLRGQGRINLAGPGSFIDRNGMQIQIHQFSSTAKCASTDPTNSFCETSDRGDHFGVGDILLRTKYRFTNHTGFNYSGGLVLRLPSGSEDDFQGLGATTIEPLFVASRQFELPWPVLQGPHDFHLNLGIEANADNVDRSRGRYAIGVTAALSPAAAFLVDVIGSSGLTNQDVSTSVPMYSEEFPCNPPTCNPDEPIGTRSVTSSFRTDIVDISLGFKEQVLSNTTLFAGVIVPLNNDGLRPDVIPNVGCQVGF